MQQVRVVTDSGADLSAEIIAELGMTVAPLIVLFDKEMYPDGLLTIEEFWNKIVQILEPHKNTQGFSFVCKGFQHARVFHNPT